MFSSSRSPFLNHSPHTSVIFCPALPSVFSTGTPAVFTPKSYKYPSSSGTTRTALLRLCSAIGSKRAGRKRPFGAGAATAARHSVSSKPGSAHPFISRRASYTSPWRSSSKRMGDGAVLISFSVEKIFSPFTSTANAVFGAARNGALSNSHTKPPKPFEKPLPRMSPTAFLPRRRYRFTSYLSYTTI